MKTPRLPYAHFPARVPAISLPFLSLVASCLSAGSLRQITGPPIQGVRVQPIPERSVTTTLFAPLFDMIDYVQRLGPSGAVYLLFWVCVAFAICALLDRSGKGRGAVMARLLVVFIFAIQVLFLCLFLSSFCGKSVRLGLLPRPPRPGEKNRPAFAVGDFHCHSYLSTGLLTPGQLVEWHRRHGYNAMSITDSNLIAASVQARDYARKRYPDFQVIVGEEYKRSGERGLHLVLLGIHNDIRPDRFGPAGAVAETHRQGGIAIVAHPWSAKGMSIKQMAALRVDGFEVFNGVMVASGELIAFCKKRHLIALGATDLKGGSEAHVWNVFPLPSSVSARSVLGESLILAALKHQRDRVYTCMDQKPVEGFRHPDWRPPANRWSPFLELGTLLADMTLAKGVAWTSWLLVIGALAYSRVLRLQRTCGRYGGHLLLGLEEGPGYRKSEGWYALIASCAGIVICGAFTTAYKLKEVFPMPASWCFLIWIALDVIALQSLGKIQSADRTGHLDRFPRSRVSGRI